MPSKKTKQSASIGIVDIFAGPGGLGEGFSSFRDPATGASPFRIGVSAEMETTAHATLRLRAFYRLLSEREGDLPRAYLEFLRVHAQGKASEPGAHFGSGPFASLWQQAEAEALNIRLGVPENNALLYDQIRKIKKTHERIVLIGGPPCQAYSLVGRSRQAKVLDFEARGDSRHFLYRQYLGILAEFRPDVFIMENVKGILSSTVGGRRMFDAIRRDLCSPSTVVSGRRVTNTSPKEYLLVPVHVSEGVSRSATASAEDPGSFVVRCEDHGIPQARHRVIIMGIRLAYESSAAHVAGIPTASRTSVGRALEGLPKLRSGLSKSTDTGTSWAAAVNTQKSFVLRALGKSDPELRSIVAAVAPDPTLPRRAIRRDGRSSRLGVGSAPDGAIPLLNHETRGHMELDLRRYLFCSAFASLHGRSPTSKDLVFQSPLLAPDHENWRTGKFADRFKVQVRGRPSATVTSHLSKDGNAFIHWDPAQCRSLSVREAARLQTFPDDYLFLGGRTNQFVQVGNAVPPLIARQIARIVWDVLR